jgi:hypothetical protein
LKVVLISRAVCSDGKKYDDIDPRIDLHCEQKLDFTPNICTSEIDPGFPYSKAVGNGRGKEKAGDKGLSSEHRST